jgi:hypothetical protein
MKGEIQGVSRLLQVFENRRKQAPLELREKLHDAGDVILAKALYYVPKDTLALAKSGRVSVAGDAVTDKMEVTVEFGGDVDGTVLDYVVFVHEDMEAYHAPPTCAKFLTRAYRETKAEVAKIIRGNKIADRFGLITKHSRKSSYFEFTA